MKEISYWGKFSDFLQETVGAFLIWQLVVSVTRKYI